MTKGDIVIVALPGDSGKPRPAVLLISEDLANSNSRLLVLPMTTTIMDWPVVRVTIEPTSINGLRARSQIMIDRATSVARDKVGDPVGKLSADEITVTAQKFLTFLGLA